MPGAATARSPIPMAAQAKGCSAEKFAAGPKLKGMVWLSVCVCVCAAECQNGVMTRIRDGAASSWIKDETGRQACFCSWDLDFQEGCLL